jgi:hypothetical protein
MSGMTEKVRASPRISHDSLLKIGWPTFPTSGPAALPFTP